jgi:wobble nucleotide-excising tRNase
MVELERAIKLAHPVISDVAAFCAFSIPDNIGKQIANATRALTIARRAEAIAQRRVPHPIRVEPLKSYEQTLSSSVATISQETAERVAKHIEQHGMETHGERWIKYGVEHTQDNKCPFCSQDIQHVDVVNAFRDFFSEAYSEHTRKIEDASQRLNTLVGGGPTGFNTIMVENSADLAFWNEVTEFADAPAIAAEHASQIADGITLLANRFDEKLASPFSQIRLASDEDKIGAALELLSQYNGKLGAYLDEIERVRREVQQADPVRAEAVLNSRRAIHAKAEEPLSNHAAEYLALIERRKELNAKKVDLQAELRTYAATTLSARQRKINDLLTLFGTNFQIAKAKAGFIGREANTEYAIELGAHVLQVGVGSQSEPSFKTVLSAGDKSTLALALFFTQVRSDAALNNAVIVFDDPFSSQDMQRQWETGSQIRRLADDARQVIVLSHDPRFLHLIEKDADPNICSAFQLILESDSEAAVKQWSSVDELKSNYMRQAERIRHFASTGQFLSDTSAESLIKDLRPFLEDFIKLRFPGRFDELKMLDAMVDEIEAGGAADPLFKDVSNLRALNEYTRANHHGGSFRPDVDALRAQCRRAVTILGTY